MKEKNGIITLAMTVLLVLTTACGQTKPGTPVVAATPTDYKIEVISHQNATSEPQPIATLAPTVTPAPTFTFIPTMKPKVDVFPVVNGWKYVIADLTTQNLVLSPDGGESIQVMDEPLFENVDPFPNLGRDYYTIIKVNENNSLDTPVGEYVEFRWIGGSESLGTYIKNGEYQDITFATPDGCSEDASLAVYKAVAKSSVYSLTSAVVGNNDGYAYSIYLDAVTLPITKTVVDSQGNEIKAVKFLYVITNGDFRTGWMAYGVKYQDGTSVPSFLNNWNGIYRQDEDLVENADEFFQKPHTVRFAYTIGLKNGKPDFSNLQSIQRVTRGNIPDATQGYMNAIVRSTKENVLLNEGDGGENILAFLNGGQVTEDFIFFPTGELIFHLVDIEEGELIVNECELAN